MSPHVQGFLSFNQPEARRFLKHLLQLRCSNVETHQTNTELAIRASNKGGPNSISKNHTNFRCQKRTKTSLLFCLMKEVPCFQSLQSRRFIFFFLRCGRSRSKARSLHENKQLSRKLQHGHGWSHANWQIMTTKHKTPQPKGKTQIPQPDLRLTITRTAKQTAKGARAQQKQPQKICQGHSGENPLCRKLKNMQQTN